MPSNEVKKENINARIFEDVVHACGSSINKLGSREAKICSARTLYRSLAQGKMRKQYLEKIARYLNVDIRLLKGDLHRKAESIDNELIKRIYLSDLRPENYPHYPERKQESSENEEQDKNPLNKIIEGILPLFEIPLNRYDVMDFEERWLLQHDFLCAVMPVIRKHFDADNRGRKDMPDLEKAISDHEDFREDHYERIFAREVLRKEFMKNPPKGYTAVEIAKMNEDKLIALDIDRQLKEKI